MPLLDLAGRWQSPVVMLARGLTSDTSFAKWVKESQLGQANDVRRSGAVTAFDRAGAVIKKERLTPAASRRVRDPRNHLDVVDGT